MNEQVQASGWALFAGTVLIIVGFLDFFYGLAGILNDDVLVGSTQHGVIIADFTTWGWVHAIIGAIMVLTGLGLYTGNEAARVMGVIFAAISAIAQIGLITAFPLWSILIIALDVAVIYNLTVRGGVTEVRAP